MKDYKYLVMEINGDNGVFLSADSSGGRCTEIDANETFFDTDCCDSKTYWHYPKDLICGFSRWYLRKGEKESYHQINKVYSATNKYRFFKVDCKEVKLANKDLSKYEVSEEVFIKSIINSNPYQTLRTMMTHGDRASRIEEAPVTVNIVINFETDTWCWTSDYLRDDDYLEHTITKYDIPVGVQPDGVKDYIKSKLGLEYRFAGNDSYSKRKGLEEE